MDDKEAPVTKRGMADYWKCVGIVPKTVMGKSLPREYNLSQKGDRYADL